MIYLLHSTWNYVYHRAWCLEQGLVGQVLKHLSKETASQGAWASVMTVPLVGCAAQSLAWLCHFFLQEGRKRPLLFLRPLLAPTTPAIWGCMGLELAHPTPVHQGALSLAQEAEGCWEEG